MAIIFDTQLPNRLLLAYDNNIVRFGSNSVLPVKKCEITIDSQTITLYPNPQGKFIYNFKAIIGTIINTDNFKDDSRVYNTPLTTNSRFNSESNGKAHKETFITYKIIFQNGNLENFNNNRVYKFISAYSVDNRIFDIDTSRITYLLSPKIRAYNYQNHNLKCWYGYPFDISIINKQLQNIIRMFGDTTEVSYKNTDGSLILRLLISNGKINDLLGSSRYMFYFLDSMFEENKNKTKLIIYSGTNDPNATQIILEKVTPSCNEGHYIKWINHLGGWNYWLFNRGDISRNTKSLGEIENDFFNLNEDISESINIGYNSFDTIKVFETIDEDYYQLLMSDLIESPKVYLFTAKPNTIDDTELRTYLDWTEVKIKDKTTLIQDKRFNRIKYEFDIELPKRKTRTI